MERQELLSTNITLKEHIVQFSRNFYSRMTVLASTVGIAFAAASSAEAQVSVLTVDCTPFVSPGPSSYGPTHTMGMALQAVDQGSDFNVTEVTPAAFRAMTAAQLSAFDLIAVNNHPFRLGDGCVPGAGNGLGTTWHSAVGIISGGRVVLNSHDAPRFKLLRTPPTGPLFTGFEPFGTMDLVRQAGLWAGGLPGETGLLIFNDAARFVSGPGVPILGVGWDNPELNLPPAWGIVDLDQAGGQFMNGGYTDILPAFAGHPLYVGLSDQRFAQNTISSFSANMGDTSFHSVFDAFNPSIFTLTEVVTNAGIIDVGGLCTCAGFAAPGPDGKAITLIRDIITCPPDFVDADLLLLKSHSFLWTDPRSGGEFVMTENVYEGCRCGEGEILDRPCEPRVDMTWEYVVENISYNPQPGDPANPIPGDTNGFSGFQIVFPGPVPELCNQQSPAIGGLWHQNSFSGQFPPFGIEWDVPAVGDLGILPGETGVFSFCSAERFDMVVEAEGEGGGPAGWAHTWSVFGGEPIIDADGTVSPGDGFPGAVDVACGNALASFPVVGIADAGLDWFDNDHDGQWTFGFGGDDLHSEDPGTCSTAIRDGDHDLGFDCKVLDMDGSLVDGQQVDCDLEVNVAFTEPHVSNGGCPSSLNGIKYHDANGDTSWDDGEDIVLDPNGNDTFDCFAGQDFLFHGFQSVPGEMFPEQLVVGVACDSDDRTLCKKVKYADEDGDGLIEVGELINFRVFIVVRNTSPNMWARTIVQDRFGAEIAVSGATATHGRVTMSTKGRSEKVFLVWDIGMLPPGGVATLEMETETDLTPDGYQSYTSCSYHDFNSGAVLKFRMPDGKQRSFETGSVVVSVLTEDALGDCDGDGFTDAEELECGTDPHVPAVDRIIDADGTASAGTGIPAAVELTCGAPLTSFPVTGAADAGLDWFDNDHDGQWTFGFAGDDLHSEDPNTCPSAFRDGFHDLGFDCKVLDMDCSLLDRQQVDCDLEVNVPFTEPHLSNGGCPSSFNGIRYYDANGDGSWDDGEDIVWDANGNGIFD